MKLLSPTPPNILHRCQSILLSVTYSLISIKATIFHCRHKWICVAHVVVRTRKNTTVIFHFATSVYNIQPVQFSMACSIVFVNMIWRFICLGCWWFGCFSADQRIQWQSALVRAAQSAFLKRLHSFFICYWRTAGIRFSSSGQGDFMETVEVF